MNLQSLWVYRCTDHVDLENFVSLVLSIPSGLFTLPLLFGVPWLLREGFDEDISFRAECPRYLTLHKIWLMVSGFVPIYVRRRLLWQWQRNALLCSAVLLASFTGLTASSQGMPAGIGAWGNRVSGEEIGEDLRYLLAMGAEKMRQLRLWGLHLKREGTVERAVRLPAFLTVAGVWDKVVDLEKKS